MRPGDVPRMKQDSMASRIVHDDGPDPIEARKAALQKRIRVIRAAFEQTKAVHLGLSVAASSRGTARTTAARKLLSKLDEVKAPVGFSNQFRQVRNEMVSFTEECSLRGKSSVSPVKGTRELLLSLKDEYAKSKASLASVKETVLSAEDRYLEDLQKRAAEIIRRTSKEKKKLESLKDKEYSIARIPVVPVYQGYVSTERAARAGLKIESLGGYPLIHDQLVIGVSRAALADVKKGKTKALDFVKELIPILETAMGKKLYLVSDKGEPALGGVWYWVADSRTLRSLQDNVIGKTKMLGWGFGFSA